MAAKKKAAANAKTIDIPMSPQELELLRDVFGLVMPIVEAETNEIVEAGVCVVLAQTTGRAEVEAALWAKIVRACEALGLTVGDEAPNYACSAAHVPGMHVYKLED